MFRPLGQLCAIGEHRAVAEVPSHLRVVRPGYLRASDLPGYLGGALVVAYPSQAEGFGLPVLEAMACGAPVLTARRLSLPEVGGDAVAYTEPDAASIAEGLRRLLADDEARRALGAAGHGAGLGGGERADGVLDRGDGGRAHAELLHSQPDEERGCRGLAADLAAQRDSNARSRGFGDSRDEAEHRGVDRVCEVGDRCVAAFGGQGVLREVVRADAEEVDMGCDRPGHEGESGDLDHHTDLEPDG